MKYIEEILKNPLIPFLTFFMGLLIGNRLALGRDKRKEFIVASQEFYNTFLDLRDRFSDQSNKEQLDEYLVKNFSSHKKSVISFRQYIPWYKRKSFDRAWNNYRYGVNESVPPPEKELPLPILSEYWEGLSYGENDEETREVVLLRIHKLLSFAKIK